MIRLNRTTEYGLMALKHMGRKRRIESSEVTSAREIADAYGLPFEITAKTLQRLKDTGLIQSAQGARGGYTLQRELGGVTLAEFLELMEGPQALVACASGLPAPQPAKADEAAKCGCEYEVRCEIRHCLGVLNERVHAFLSGILLSELAGGAGGEPYPRETRRQEGMAVEPETEEKLLDETANLSG